MRLALDMLDDGIEIAYPVQCQVSVRARRLGGPDESSILLGEESQTIASPAEPASLRCKGLPLPAGLYRLEAVAAVRGPGDARASGMAFVGGSLIRAF
jgi:hypothetical protein